MQRKAKIFSAPGLDQNMPDCLQRAPMTVLQPASTTPEPIKQPCARKAPYCIRATLRSKQPNASSTAGAWGVPTAAWRVSLEPLGRPSHRLGASRGPSSRPRPWAPGHGSPRAAPVPARVLPRERRPAALRASAWILLAGSPSRWRSFFAPAPSGAPVCLAAGF